MRSDGPATRVASSTSRPADRGSAAGATSDEASGASAVEASAVEASAVATGAADAERAVARGERALTVALHGARAEVHDWVAGAPGGFRDALAALAAGRSLGLELRVTTRLTRSNARVLGELPRLLRARAVRRWVVTLDDGPLDTAVHPRLGMAAPSALAAIHAARGLGVEAFLAGLPRCVMGRFHDRAWPIAPRRHPAVCDGCAARARCPGLPEGYAERFGVGELRPLERDA